MLRDKLPKERLALVGLAALAIAAGTYAVVRSQRKPAPIVFQEVGSQKATERPAADRQTLTKIADDSVVVVHATGGVKTPGIQRLTPGSRVDDAIKAAGGATADADLDSINLAAKLVDGSQVFVPRKGKPQDPALVADSYRGGSVAETYSPGNSPKQPAGGGGRTKKEPPSQPVSLNTASAAELQAVPGIGPATAEKILEYRKEHGKFTSIDEVTAVKGIGEKKLATMRKYLKL